MSRLVRLILRLTALLALLCVLPATAETSSPVRVDPAFRSAHIASHADYACGGDIGHPAAYRAITRNAVSLGFRRPRCHIRIPVTNATAAPLAVVLSSDFNVLDRLDVRLMTVDGRQLDQETVGDSVPYRDRRLKTRTLAVPLTLPATSTVRIDLYVDTTSTMYLPLRLSTPTAFAERIAITDGLIGMVYGVTLGLLLYHLMLWFQTRERVDLAYLGYVSLTLVFFGFEQGSFYRFWPDAPDWNNLALYTASFLVLAAGIVFARAFLRTRESPLLHRASGILAGILILLALIQPLFPTREVAPLASLAALVVLTGLMGVGAWRWRQGLPEGRYFLLAWGLLLLVGAVFVLMMLLGVPGIESVILCAQAAFAAQQVLLSYALAQRMRNLQASSQALERESRIARAESIAKSEFLARMSHEIRTPINAMLGVSQLLDTEDGDAARRQAQLAILRQSGEQLLSLINDILDYSKIDAGMLVLEETDFDLPALLGETAELFRMQAAQKELGFHAELDPAIPARISGDPTRWRQVLYNLLANAIKFTDTGVIRIQAQWLAETADTPGHCEIRITDTGIGMSTEQLQRLFTSFHQADPSITRRFGGTGLGLAISKQLVDLMGGRLQVESLPGSGTSFRLSLPGRPAAVSGARPGVDGPVNSGLDRLRVLVCEDHPVNQTIIAAMLARLGVAESRVLANGRLGLECLAAEPDRWDVVLMDCEMPVLDGLSAVRELRARERTEGRQPLPVIALTAHVMPDYRARCLEAGMNAFLGKPVILSELAQRLREVCAPAVPPGR